MSAARIVLFVKNMRSPQSQALLFILRKRYPRRRIEYMGVKKAPSSYLDRNVWRFTSRDVLDAYPEDKPNWSAVLWPSDMSDPMRSSYPALHLCSFNPRSPQPKVLLVVTNATSKRRRAAHKALLGGLTAGMKVVTVEATGPAPRPYVTERLFVYADGSVGDQWPEDWVNWDYSSRLGLFVRRKSAPTNS